MLSNIVARINKTLTILRKTVVIDDFYELDFSKGIIRNKFDKGRVFIISAGTFGIFQDEIYRASTKDAPHLLQGIGRAYGRALAHVRSSQGLNVGAVVDLQVLASVAGWGKVSVIGNLNSDPEPKLTVKDCIFCSPPYKRSIAKCDFLAGVVQGVADELFPKEFKVSEGRCIGMGDEFCEMKLQRALR